MKPIGRHLLCELSGCNIDAIANEDVVRLALESAAAAANATILNGYFHKFEPAGVTGMLCLAESHLCIHTWPEKRYASVDIFTCGERTLPENAIRTIKTAFDARQTQIREISRGIESANGYSNRDVSAFRL